MAKRFKSHCVSSLYFGCVSNIWHVELTYVWKVVIFGITKFPFFVHMKCTSKNFKLKNASTFILKRFKGCYWVYLFKIPPFFDFTNPCRKEDRMSTSALPYGVLHMTRNRGPMEYSMWSLFQAKWSTPYGSFLVSYGVL